MFLISDLCFHRDGGYYLCYIHFIKKILCVAGNVGETITFHVLTPVIVDESTCSSVEMEDESSTHNISSADTISMSSSMAAMDGRPSVHPEVSSF
jgi:hypothetical protein